MRRVCDDEEKKNDLQYYHVRCHDSVALYHCTVNHPAAGRRSDYAGEYDSVPDGVSAGGNVCNSLLRNLSVTGDCGTSGILELRKRHCQGRWTDRRISAGVSFCNGDYGRDHAPWKAETVVCDSRYGAWTCGALCIRDDMVYDLLQGNAKVYIKRVRVSVPGTGCGEDCCSGDCGASGKETDYKIPDTRIEGIDRREESQPEMTVCMAFRNNSRGVVLQ